MNPTVEDYITLLENDAVQRLEDQIASSHGVKVSRDRIELFAKIVRDVISASQLSCDEVSNEITQNSDLIRDFGIQVLNADARSPAEQEDGSIVLERGDLTAGAGIGYAVYFHFLRTGDEPGLINFLCARRIPSAQRFATELQELYRKVVDAT